MTNWLVRSLVLRKLARPWLARCEMTAAAIASSSAIIDFHGRVLRLTRSTCAERSICLTSCTRDSSLRGCPPNAIRQEASAAGLPGTTGGLAWQGSKRGGRAAQARSPAPTRSGCSLDERRAHGEPELAADAGRHARRRGVPGGGRGDHAEVAADLDRCCGEEC